MSAKNTSIALVATLIIYILPSLLATPPYIPVFTYTPTDSWITSSTYISRQGVIVIGFSNGVVAAYSLSGAKIWEVSLGQHIRPENIAYVEPGFVLAELNNRTIFLLNATSGATYLRLYGSKSFGELLSYNYKPPYLLLVLRSYLFLIDLEKKEAILAKIIYNRSVRGQLVGDKIFLVSIETLCKICLDRNDKEIFVYKLDGSKEYSKTWSHVLNAAPVGNLDKIVILWDNNTLTIHEYRGKIASEGKIVFREVKSGLKGFFSNPNGTIYYVVSLDENNILRLDAYYWSTKAHRSLNLGVKWMPGSSLRVIGGDNGVAVLTLSTSLGNYFIVANFSSKDVKVVQLDFKVSGVRFLDRKVLVWGSHQLALYSCSKPPRNYTLTVIVKNEDGEPINGAIVRVDTLEAITGDKGIARFQLKPGKYVVNVLSEKFAPSRINVSLISDQVVEIKLYPKLYELNIQTYFINGTRAEATVYILRGGKVVGVGTHHMLPEGNYTVVASLGEQNITRNIYLRRNETVRLEFSGKVSLKINVDVPPGVSNVTVMVYDLVSGVLVGSRRGPPPFTFSLYPGRYRVRVFALGAKPLVRDISLERSEEIDISLEPRGVKNYSAVIYGLHTCPYCQRVLEVLTKKFGKVDFYEISDKEIAKIFYVLYEGLELGKDYAIPLTVILADGYPVVVAVGDQPDEYWDFLLSIPGENETIIVDERGRVFSAKNIGDKILKIMYPGGEEGGKEEEKTSVAISPEKLLVIVVTMAAADSINPCTFLVFTAMIFLTMSIAGRRRAAAVAAAFIASIYASYFVLGLGFIKAFSYIPWLKYVIAGLAFLFGAHSIYSGWGGRFKSPIPARFKKFIEGSVEKISSTASPVIAAGLGLVISLTLLPCSSGPYLVATAALSQLGIMGALGYLALYNAIFVAPLVGIATVTIVAVEKSRRLKRLRGKVPGWMELVAGILLILIGIYALISL